VKPGPLLPSEFSHGGLFKAANLAVVVLSEGVKEVMESVLAQVESASAPPFSLLQRFMEDVRSHGPQIEEVKAKGDPLKAQGSPEDKKMVDRWVGDLLKRYDDLNYVMEEKKVSQIYRSGRKEKKAIKRTISLLSLQKVNNAPVTIFRLNDLCKWSCYGDMWRRLS